MPVTARLSRKFYERFGDDLTNELVEWDPHRALDVSLLGGDGRDPHRPAEAALTISGRTVKINVVRVGPPSTFPSTAVFPTGTPTRV